MHSQRPQPKASSSVSTPAQSPVTPSVSIQQSSIVDLLSELLDLPGLSPDFLSTHLDLKKVNEEFLTEYFDTHHINRQLFIEYLNLYTDYRSPERASYFGAAIKFVKKGVDMTKATVKGEESTDEGLKTIVTDVTKKLQAANSFKDFYKLIFVVREYAKIAQEKTTWSNSLLSCTLHGLAGLIIFELQENCRAFGLKTAALNAMITQKRKQISESNNKKNGEDTADHNKELNALYLELAQLGDVDAANEAMQRGLLPYLTLPSILEIKELEGDSKRDVKIRVNKAIPVCLQAHYYLALYELKYRRTVAFMTFGDFQIKAKEKGIVEAEKIKLQQRSLESDALAIKRQLGKIPSQASILAQPLTEDYIPEDHTEPSSASADPDTDTAGKEVVYDEDENEEVEKVNALHPVQTPGVGFFASASGELNTRVEVDVDAAQEEYAGDNAATPTSKTSSPGARRL